MKKYNIKVNGVSYEVEVEEVGAQSQSSMTAAEPVKAAAPSAAPKSAPQPVASGSAGSNSIKAPMPGTIVKINCKAGDSVKQGDVLVVLEAMKMENDITAPADCVISSIAVNSGATVATGDVLVTYN